MPGTEQVQTPNAQPMRAFLSPRDVAIQTGMNLSSVYVALWGGRLRARKRDGIWLIRTEDVREWRERAQERTQA